MDNIFEKEGFDGNIPQGYCQNCGNWVGFAHDCRHCGQNQILEVADRFLHRKATISELRAAVKAAKGEATHEGTHGPAGAEGWVYPARLRNGVVEVRDGGGNWNPRHELILVEDEFGQVYTWPKGMELNLNGYRRVPVSK